MKIEKRISINDLLVRKYVEAIRNNDYVAAAEWRKQLKDRPWYKFWL